MASLRKEFFVGATRTAAWDAVADFGAVHDRLAVGFVTDTKFDGQDRVVTFLGGAQARERLVSVDHERRRLVYAVVESALGLGHHQASVEVLDGDVATDRTRVVWITDVLPDDRALIIDALMDQGVDAMARTLVG